MTGNGAPIDDRGWRRLSVMMSTGLVVGAGDSVTEIEAKTNGIGSKNLGLRTLFLIGDRILIRSASRKTVRDLALGTLPTPDADPASRSSRGIEIRVRYRTVNDRLLQAFDSTRESQALERFALELSDILIKLAQPGSRRSLTQVVVTSARLRRRIVWTQSATSFSTRVRDVVGVRRRVRRYDFGGNTGPARSVAEELEFQRSVPLPAELANQPFPGYFKVPRGRVRIAVSLRMRGDRLEPASNGLFYYPLGVRSAPTGIAVNACAPFLMNGDRSALLDHPANARLQAITADLVAELLVHDWYYRFGPRAYAALIQRGNSHSAFSAAVQNTLQTQPVWATASIVGGRRGLHEFALAAKLVLPAAPSLSGYLSNLKCTLDGPLFSEPTLVEFVEAAGADRFTVNSFVRIRCAGKDGSALQTRPGKGEAHYYYEGFEAKYSGAGGVALQRRMGATLDERRRHLSAANMHDLKMSPATLTADGSVGAPANMWFVPSEIQAGTHLLPSSRLHPDLASSTTLVQLCRRFSVTEWLITICERARNGTAGDAERDAASLYIRSVEARLPSKALGAVRRSPILRDHRGAWVEPTAMIAPTVFGADVLEPVLHFPHGDYARETALLANLRIRRQLSGEDLVAFGQNHVTEKATAQRFEAVLGRSRQLLSSRVVSQLGTLPILESSSGALRAAQSLYVGSSSTAEVVGPNAEFVVGPNLDLYRRLGCRTRPSSEDVLKYLRELREGGEPPPHPDHVYGALVTALRAEGKPTTDHQAAPIVWVDSRGYFAPSEVLVGMRVPRVLSKLPVVRGPESLCAALVELEPLPQCLRFDWSSGELREDAELDRAQQGLGAPEGQAELQDSIGGEAGLCGRARLLLVLAGGHRESPW